LRDSYDILGFPDNSMIVLFLIWSRFRLTVAEVIEFYLRRALPAPKFSSL